MPKQGLREILHNRLKNLNGETLWLHEIEEICHAEHYKVSNAERELRPSKSPSVARIRNDKGAVIGYYWIVAKLVQGNKKTEQTALFETPKKRRFD